MSNWNNFEHQIWQKINKLELGNKLFLLTVSGGADSMVLVEVLLRLGFKDNIKVLHFHHGDFENKAYRDQAFECVRQFCLQNGIAFEFEKSVNHLKSESEFRAERQAFFKKFKTERTIFVTGHHLDDVLETRLIKMIRGTGLDGLRAFEEYNSEVFRPFLSFPKLDLLQYGVEKNVMFVEDPTNSDSDYLRNWIRNEWLPALNQKSVGGVVQLAKSIDRLMHQENSFELQFEQQFATQIKTKNNQNGTELVVDRMWFFGLTTKDQLKALSKCLSSFKNIEFTTGQLQEINKRLDKNQKEHIFEILGLNWVINPHQIMIRFIEHNGL